MEDKKNKVINIKEFIESKDKEEIKDRDSALDYRTILMLFIPLLIGFIIGAVRLIDWGATHQLQVPWYFEIRDGSLFNTPKTRMFYRDITSEILVSPKNISTDNTSDSNSDMTIIEQKILDAFGYKNYSVMRAIAKCESGMRPEAVNWESRDVGLFQINWTTWEEAISTEFGYTLSDMFDVDKNIEVARWIWDRDGDGDGDINPWVATTTQCFRDEL